MAVTTTEAIEATGATGATEGVVRRRRVYLDDLDGFGMLHHAAYPLLLDHAVIDYWADAGWHVDPSASVQAIRELTLTYHQPVTAVGDVDVHFWISRAGRTSVTYAFRIVSADGSVLHADGTRTLVNLDPVTLRPTPLTDDMWEVAAPLLGTGVTRS
jgi:acyl-CoA thioester hydrolase